MSLLMMTNLTPSNEPVPQVITEGISPVSDTVANFDGIGCNVALSRDRRDQIIDQDSGTPQS